MFKLRYLLLVGCLVVGEACIHQLYVNKPVAKEVQIGKEQVYIENVIDDIKSVGELVLTRETGSASIEYNSTKGSLFSWLTNTQTIVSLDYEVLLGIDLNDVVMTERDGKLMVLYPSEFKILAIETDNKDIESNYSFLSQYEDNDLLISLENKIIEDIKDDVITDEIKVECMKSFEDNMMKLADTFNIEIEFY